MAAYVLLQPLFFYLVTTAAIYLLESNDMANAVTLRLVFILFPLIQVAIMALLDHLASGGTHHYLIPTILYGSMLMTLLNPAWGGGFLSLCISSSYYLALAAWVVRIDP